MDDGFNPAVFAAKAFAIATGITVGAFALAVGGVMSWFGVKDVSGLAGLAVAEPGGRDWRRRQRDAGSKLGVFVRGQTSRKGGSGSYASYLDDVQTGLRCRYFRGRLPARVESTVPVRRGRRFTAFEQRAAQRRGAADCFVDVVGVEPFSQKVDAALGNRSLRQRFGWYEWSAGGGFVLPARRTRFSTCWTVMFRGVETIILPSCLYSARSQPVLRTQLTPHSAARIPLPRPLPFPPASPRRQSAIPSRLGFPRHQSRLRRWRGGGRGGAQGGGGVLGRGEGNAGSRGGGEACEAEKGMGEVKGKCKALIASSRTRALSCSCCVERTSRFGAQI